MSDLDEFEREYSRALASFLQLQDEALLSGAYELGRRAMGLGLGVLDLAAVHRAATVQLIPGADAPGARVAADFFRETLSPFEMALRGYRAANEELERLNEALHTQTQNLEAANRELESFSYSVSHDLRAPLRSIDGFSLALLEDCGRLLDDDGRRHLEHIRTAAARMSELIDDLLSLASVARASVKRTYVDVTRLARDVFERLRVTQPERDIALEAEAGLHAKADPQLLRVVFENLIGNAWKFTSKTKGAAISVGYEKPGVFFVRDNGAGFEMAYAKRLFGAFQRLHAASEFEGTGIGLATVQRIIQRHEGRIWAEGRVGEGATFFFTLDRSGAR